MIALRDVNDSDRDTLLQWRNADQVRRWMLDDSIIPRDRHEQWFSNMRRDASAKYWVIAQDGVDVGVCSLSAIDRATASCASAIYIAAVGGRGQGSGTAAEYLLLNHAFGEEVMNIVTCEVIDGNDRSMALHMRLGFSIVRSRQVVRGSSSLPATVFGLELTRERWESVGPIVRSVLSERGLLR